MQIFLVGKNKQKSDDLPARVNNENLVGEAISHFTGGQLPRNTK
jgi:hypothetical protein